MNTRDAAATKARILSVAEDIFSRDGFDGARVDDIAKEAGVNKALTYYYFKSKNEILETLCSSLIEDARKMLVQSMEGTPNICGEDGYRKLFNQYIEFVSRKRKIIKVAIGESAKTGASPSVVMELGNLIIHAELEALRKEYETRGLCFPEDQQGLLVMEFFTGLAPFLCYALYKDQWEDHYKMSEESLQDYLYQAFKKTHLAAHLPT